MGGCDGGLVATPARLSAVYVCYHTYDMSSGLYAYIVYDTYVHIYIRVQTTKPAKSLNYFTCFVLEQAIAAEDGDSALSTKSPTNFLTLCCCIFDSSTRSLVRSVKSTHTRTPRPK